MRDARGPASSANRKRAKLIGILMDIQILANEANALINDVEPNPQLRLVKPIINDSVA